MAHVPVDLGRGGDIKRRVDVYIFPFETEQEGKKYTLHILIDKEQSRALSYFDSQVQEEGGVEISQKTLN